MMVVDWSAVVVDNLGSLFLCAIIQVLVVCLQLRVASVEGIVVKIGSLLTSFMGEDAEKI